MKKGYFRYIVLIVILILFGIGMYVIFGVDEARERKASSTLIVGDSAVFQYSSRSWMRISSQSSISNLNWQEFKTYVNNEYFGDYLVWKSDKWYLFDQNRNAVSYQGNLFAYQAEFNMEFLPFSMTSIVDYSYPKQVLADHGLDPNSSYTLSNLATFDFDRDGAVEEFYLISNVFSSDYLPEKYFSFVFMVDEGEVYMMYEDVDDNTGVNGCKPNIYTVGDFDDDQKFEIILMCSKYSTQTPVVMLYEWAENGFKIVISNQ